MGFGNSKKDDKKHVEGEIFYIHIMPDGPYVVYGNPPVDQEIIMPNEDGNSWTYRRGKHFDIPAGEFHLCRCGNSLKKPFCDGHHVTADWDPKETASFVSIMENVKWYEGEDISLADNEKFCAYARFCDAYGRVWNLVSNATDDKQKELFFHETGHCPSGRLIGFDNKTQQPIEPEFEKSIGIIEDPHIKVSGPIWVKGGIRVYSANGKSYEVRNRVTLCRCGKSSNKPFCDGTHASFHWEYNVPIPEPKDDDKVW